MMDLLKVQLEGRVVRERVSQGSKSERDAISLKTPDGETYLLRRQSAPAFGDKGLDHLVGRSIRASGLAADKTLIMRDWNVLD
ncbi:MAG: hypothetical protein ACJ8DK_13620 [Microvirga sp.]